MNILNPSNHENNITRPDRNLRPREPLTPQTQLFQDLPETLPANRQEVASLDHTPESVTSREVIIMQKAQVGDL